MTSASDSLARLHALATRLPRLCQALEPTGGQIKVEPEDFVVEEMPAYEPCGEGEHLFLWIEKRDVSAGQLVSHLATALEIPAATIGVAGMKDRRAVTRQYVSVPATAEVRLSEVDNPAIRVLRHRRHGNKLRTGHLRGNRFAIRVRGVSQEAALRGGEIEAHIARYGVPNHYGLQRFGREGSTLATGFRMVSKGQRQGRGRMKRLALSALQSALFNAYMAARMDRGQLHTVLLGDLMQVCASGGPFVADDVGREQERFDAREVVPTGPMVGPRMRRAAQSAATHEEALLEEFGLSWSALQPFAKLMPGTRRPLLIWPQDLAVESLDEGYRLHCSLPSGAYATVVMREFVGEGIA